MLFTGLPPASLESVIDSMHSVHIGAGRDIIKQACRNTAILNCAQHPWSLPTVITHQRRKRLRAAISPHVWHCCLQGATDAHELFVMESGACDVFVARPGDLVPKRVKAYSQGSAFGELALLYAAPRAATVTATAPCKLWVAERRVVATIRRGAAEAMTSAKLALLESVPMFGCLTDAHRQLLAGALEQVCCGRWALGCFCTTQTTA